MLFRSDNSGTENLDKNEAKIGTITNLIKAGSKVVYNGRTYKAMDDAKDVTGQANLDQIDDKDASVITAAKAYDLIAEELKLASSIGADKAVQTVTSNTTADAQGKVSFSFNKGTVTKKEDLTFSLHVGADTDMTNKIGVNVKALDTAGLGIKGLNVKDTTGASATYALDAISEAISTVSAQRSLLGAVQNRLEHTINNLDNVVENTTAAESQIRDTDMATEMVKYSNANILSQAGQSMLAQSNQANQGVLSLLG